MCDSSRILMSPRLGSEKDEEEVHKNEFHYVFCQAVAASYWILILAFSSLKKRQCRVAKGEGGVTPEVATTKIKGIEKERDEMPIFQGA